MSAYAKNIARTILNNLRRYIAMVLITAMGAAFFVGLRSTSPDMNYTIDSYFNEQGMYDLRLMTSLGVTQEQAEAVAAMPEAALVQPAYYCDMFITLGQDSSLARIHSLDTNNTDAVNTPSLMEGCFPQSEDECLVSARFLALKGGKLGDSVHVFTGNDEDLSDTLLRESFRIVGAVESPLYISPTIGPTGKGSGNLDTYLYIPSENFASEIYTELYVRLNETDGLSRFGAEYENLIDAALDSFGERADEMALERNNDVNAEGAKKIADGRREISDARSKLSDAEKELEDAKGKLLDGERELEEKTADFEREIADAERELAEGKQKLDDGWRELEDARLELEDGEASLRELKDSMRKMADGLGIRYISDIPGKMRENLDLLAEGERELADAWRQISAGQAEISENKRKLIEAEEQLKSNAGAMEQARGMMEALESQLEQVLAGKSLLQQMAGGIPVEMYPPEMKAEWDQLEQNERQLRGGIAGIQAELDAADAAQAQIESGWKQLGEAEEELKAGRQEWREGRLRMERERAPLVELAEELEAGDIYDLPEKIQELLDKIPEAEKEIADGKIEIADAEKTLAEKTLEYEDGVRELEEGRAEGLEGIAEGRQKLEDANTELEDGFRKYEEAKAEADEKLPQAERDIADAEKKLSELGEPKGYALGLDSNIGFYGFKQDSDRIDMISRYFPLIFFLVAALVSFTSMVRVVEQDRPAAGALRSLGYSPLAILFKYVAFALAVCIPGCVLGILIGNRLFPSLIYNQGYRILYLTPALTTILQPDFFLLAFGISLISVLIPTVLVCRAELSDSPAELLRPKPPRAGKRILLERLTPVWKRMNFSAKVTARNILRYKKRFFMTVTGVAGCTAIVLTGFGMRDSIGAIAQKQFGEVFLYDFDMTLKENPRPEDMDALTTVLNECGEIEGYLYCRKDTYEAGEPGAKQDVTVCVPEDSEDFGRFISLRDLKSGRAHMLDDGAVITQKLANLLKLAPGDTLVLTDSDGNAFDIRIAGIAENYVRHYIYMNRSDYREIFGKDAEYNEILCRAPELDPDDQSGTVSVLLDNGAVNGLSFLSKSRDFYSDMISSLDFVVIVLLISGALLSFIVLFSLTGINIDERQRELATLKVLGFYERETAGYIFRENIVSTLIGTAAGLPAGIALHRFIMTTAELDMVMFGRQIYPVSFILTAALSFLFLAIVNWVMGFHIRKIDMIESLKSVE